MRRRLVKKEDFGARRKGADKGEFLLLASRHGSCRRVDPVLDSRHSKPLHHLAAARLWADELKMASCRAAHDDRFLEHHLLARGRRAGYLPPSWRMSP